MKNNNQFWLWTLRQGCSVAGARAVPPGSKGRWFEAPYGKTSMSLPHASMKRLRQNLWNSSLMTSKVSSLMMRRRSLTTKLQMLRSEQLGSIEDNFDFFALNLFAQSRSLVMIHNLCKCKILLFLKQTDNKGKTVTWIFTEGLLKYCT